MGQSASYFESADPSQHDSFPSTSSKSILEQSQPGLNLGRRLTAILNQPDTFTHKNSGKQQQQMKQSVSINLSHQKSVVIGGPFNKLNMNYQEMKQGSSTVKNNIKNNLKQNDKINTTSINKKVEKLDSQNHKENNKDTAQIASFTDYMVKSRITSLKDIAHVKIKAIFFAKCAIKGWFVNHWALILKRQDDKYLTIQFVKSGLEVDRSNTFERAKDAVARCSDARMDQVTTKKLGKTNKNIGEIVDEARKLNREYNFFTYNCRHFVLDLLQNIHSYDDSQSDRYSKEQLEQAHAEESSIDDGIDEE
eukprot:403356697